MRSVDPALPAIARLQQVLTWVIRERFGEQGIDFRAAEASVIPLVKRSAAYQEVEKEFVGGIAQLIDAAKMQGSIAPGLSTLILARALLSFIQDGAYQDMLRGGECTIEDLTNTFLAMINTSGLISGMWQVWYASHSHQSTSRTDSRTDDLLENACQPYTHSIGAYG